MNWSASSMAMALCSCWLQALQVAATEASVKVINGTVNGSIFLAGPVIGSSEQILTVEWKYSNGSVWRCVGKLLSDSRTFLFNYSDRVNLYPNGSLSLKNVQVNDSGIYSSTVTVQNGKELTQITKVNIFGNFAFERMETENNEWSKKAEFNQTHHIKSNENNGYTLENCAYVGLLTGTAIGLLVIICVSTWAIVKSCRTRSSKQVSQPQIAHNASKTKELIVDFGRKSGDHEPVLIKESEVERVLFLTH
ncbi:uncharacterized protein [Narcine bancroftii]|uniref:uncharacterized protein isoform X2 n=1 Tax=Narcine bancroftii TaxID=1343680 RepID=UPI0038322339